MIPETTFLLSGTLPPNDGSVGGSSCALTGENIAMAAIAEDSTSKRKFLALKFIIVSLYEHSIRSQVRVFGL